jgi:hypothetical protein
VRGCACKHACARGVGGEHPVSGSRARPAKAVLFGVEKSVGGGGRETAPVVNFGGDVVKTRSL